MPQTSGDAVFRFGVGQPVRRREDDRFLRGRGNYLDDIEHEGQTHAAFLRSPYAHADLVSVNVDAARAAPGVLAVWTIKDVEAAGLQELPNRAPVKDSAPVTMPLLASGKVRFVGQPIAMVVASSRAAAQDALELIEADFNELPAVVDARAALADGAPELHDVAPGNRALDWELGDAEATEKAFQSAAHKVSVTVRNQRVVVAPLETRACNAVYDKELDRWRIHIGTQGTHMSRGFLSKALGVDADKLQVITPDVGGGFGMKLMLHPEYALVAAAARDLDRPVKWTGARDESFLSDSQGRDLYSEGEGAFDAEGRLLALRVRSTANLGAYYSQFGAGVHGPFSVQLVGGLYRMPAAYVSLSSAFTNTTPTDAYRGAGRPEICFVTERVMEAAAEKLGLDPAEIRRRNLLKKEDFPYDNVMGLHFDSGDCPNTLQRGLDAAEWETREQRRAEAAKRRRVRGFGLAYYMERSGGASKEEGRIRVRGDGRVEAWVGTQSTGQGHETAWSQLIAMRLGVPFDSIDFPPGDSDLLPSGGGTGGSRSLIMAHQSFFLAADHVIETGKKIAAEKLEAAEGDIEFHPEEGGLFRIKGTDRTLDLFAAAEAGEDAFGEQAILGVGSAKEDYATFPNGAHIAEVELDPETGRIELLRYTIADDFGTILNPLLVEGQVHGGVAQGIGQALMEGAVWDAESGQPLTGSFMDYAMPRASDLPDFNSILHEDAPTPTNPLGVKGAGEAGSVGAIPATVFAAMDAMRAAGVPADVVNALEPPYAPARVWEALRTARS